MATKIKERKFPKVKYESERFDNMDVETPYITMREDEEAFEYIELTEKRFSKTSSGAARVSSIKLKKFLSLEYLQSVLTEKIYEDVIESMEADDSKRYQKWEVLAFGKKDKDEIRVADDAKELEQFGEVGKWAHMANLSPTNSNLSTSAKMEMLTTVADAVKETLDNKVSIKKA